MPPTRPEHKRVGAAARGPVPRAMSSRLRAGWRATLDDGAASSQPDAHPLSDQHGRPSLQSAMEFIRSMVWPGLVLFLVVSFWEPLQGIASRISPLVERIDSVSVGGVQLTVGKEFIEKRAPEAVRNAVSKLSPDAIRYILEHTKGVKRTNRDFLDSQERELIAADLCVELDWKALEKLQKEDPKDAVIYKAGMECATKYQDVRVFLLELVPELVRLAK